MTTGHDRTYKPVSQYLRCFVERIVAKKTDYSSKNSAEIEIQCNAKEELTSEAQAIGEIERPYGGYCFVFDTETTTDSHQALRFGVYAIYGIDGDTRVWFYRNSKLDRNVLDEFVKAGIFMTLMKSEIASSLRLKTLQQFID